MTALLTGLDYMVQARLPLSAQKMVLSQPTKVLQEAGFPSARRADHQDTNITGLVSGARVHHIHIEFADGFAYGDILRIVELVHLFIVHFCQILLQNCQKGGLAIIAIINNEWKGLHSILGNLKQIINKHSMRIFFWDFQDSNDYARQWALFAFNILVFVYTLMAFLRTWKHYHRWVFQLVPLSVNMVATFILLMLKLFEKGYQFDEIGHFIEIFTYFLFCYTFALMFTRAQDKPNRKKTQFLWNIILAILFILLMAASVLVFVGIISQKCSKKNQRWPSIATLIFQFISFAPTLYYGKKILKEIQKSQSRNTAAQDSQNTSQTTQSIKQFTPQLYYKQKVKQIKIVLSAYLISLLLRLVVSLSTLVFMDRLFECTRVDGVSIITSDSFEGQFVLVISQFNQLLPHIVIPVAMYLVPLRKMRRRNNSFHLNTKMIDEDNNSDDDQIDFNEDIVQSRVSSLLNSRLSDQSSVKSPLKNRK